MPLLSLPHRLGTRLDSIPARVPYLSPPTDRRLPLPSNGPGHGASLKVGVVWRGNPRHKNDRHRSLPPALLEPLLALEPVSFYSLQVGSAAATDLAPGRARLVDLSGLLRDYGDTAALLQQLDLVISVDTSVAHLAGALAKPAWVLLPFAPDWRWLVGRQDSPWYPTLRLFREPAPGDWTSVIEAVRAALTARLSRTVSNSLTHRQAPVAARQKCEALAKVLAEPADNTFNREAAGGL